MEQWSEYYLELYSTESVESVATLKAIRQLPIVEELGEEPTVEDVNRATECLSNGKAPGDGIPLEVIKRGKKVLMEDLRMHLCLCWKEGSVPQDMRDLPQEQGRL